ncbi:hypothetical protein [Putridiphycobacter roseus]
MLLAIVTSSCKQSKSYDYIEISSYKSTPGGIEKETKDTFKIFSKYDSVAYLAAYQKFCISEKVSQDLKEASGESIGGTPISFELINDEGINIAIFMKFDKIDSLKNEIRATVFNRKNTYLGSFDKINSANIDSAKVKKLKKYFNSNKDEFSPDGLVWHKPKSAPKYTNRNSLYCYFQSSNGKPSNLRLRMQYHSDDWLFFRKVQFSIDGKAFEFIPMNTETDSGNGGRIWEWFDESMGKSNAELLDALANAKSAKMKLIGRQYSDVKTITSSQIRDIKRSLDLFKAMGGTY